MAKFFYSWIATSTTWTDLKFTEATTNRRAICGPWSMDYWKVKTSAHQLVSGNSRSEILNQQKSWQLHCKMKCCESNPSTPVYASAKAKAIDVHVSTKGELRLLVLLRGNSFEIHVVDSKVSLKNDATKVGALSIPGHRTDVRALCFSSEKIALASASGESLKIWNRGSQNCIRTMACDYALAILFATGDRNLIVATKTGKLQIFDIAADRLLEEIAAHEGEAWTVTMSPDLRGIASDGRTRAGNFGNLNWWWTGQWRRKKTTTTTSR